MKHESVQRDRRLEAVDKQETFLETFLQKKPGFPPISRTVYRNDIPEAAGRDDADCAAHPRGGQRGGSAMGN